MSGPDLEQLKRRCADALGWDRADVDTVSLASLRELLSPKHPELAEEVAWTIQRGDHIIEAPRRRRVSR